MNSCFELCIGLILISFFLPFSKELFSKACHPVFRKPYEDMSKDVLALLAAMIGFSVLYALTSGSVGLIINDTPPSKATLQAGGLLGVFIFGSSRIWAMYRSHSFAESLIFSSVLVVAGFFSVGLLANEQFTKITDVILKRDINDLALLGNIFIFALLASFATEVIAFLVDKFVERKPTIPFSLVRSQLEGFENYPRIRTRKDFIETVKNILANNPQELQKDISWMTTNGLLDLGMLIKQYKQNTNTRIIAENSVQSGFLKSNFRKNELRFTDFSGNYRLLIIGNKYAFLGIMMGQDRLKEFPDYTMVINDPTRIAKLQSEFNSIWKIL